MAEHYEEKRYTPVCVLSVKRLYILECSSESEKQNKNKKRIQNEEIKKVNSSSAEHGAQKKENSYGKSELIQFS